MARHGTARHAWCCRRKDYSFGIGTTQHSHIYLLCFIAHVQYNTLIEDVSFFVGASTWSPGQLAAEIAQGYWIPCRGPPEMALDGICEHDEPTKESGKRPLADLWLSMMSACGDDEAKLSHLFHHDHWDENGMPCDDFDDFDDDIVVF
jgi:hypothetical protein